MLDTKTLATELTGLIGLYPGFSTIGPLPADYHRAPVAFLQDAHKLLRYDILSAVGPNLPAIVAEPYTAERTYELYEITQNTEGQFYESNVSANQGHDLTDSNYWRKTTQLSAWYGRIERGAIGKLMRELVESPPPEPLMHRQALYSKESNLAGVINKSGSFLAQRLTLLARNTAINIARLGIQVSGPLANVPMYIFHSDDAEPVAMVRLTGNTSGRTIWANPNEYLFERREGYYLIGYFESDLPAGVSAVGGQRNFQVTGCSNCNPIDYELAVGRSPYVHIQPVYVPNPSQTGVMNWADEIAVETQTWGINMLLEAECDVTQTLLANRKIMTNALLYTIACDVLEELSTSDRVNAVAKDMRAQAYVALYGQQNSKTDFGLTTKRDKKISELKAVLVSIAPNCIPAEEEEPEGLEFGSMFDGYPATNC